MTHNFNLHQLYKYFLHFLLTGFLLIVTTACDYIGMNEQQMLQSAKTYLDKGELMAASIELRNTLQKNNENAEAHYLLGIINLRIGDLTSAEKELRQAADAGWSQESIQLQLARILVSRKAFKQLLKEIKPLDTWSVDARANIAGLRALAEAGLNNKTKASIAIDEGRKLNKGAVQVLRSTAILQLAGLLEGDASNTLDTAKSLHPDNPEILLLHAMNDVRNKQLSRAAETFSIVIALDPAKFLTMTGRKARLSLARLQIAEKKYGEADSTLAPILKNSSKDPEASYLTGMIAYTQGNFNRAEDYIRKLLAVLPDNLQAHLLMGKIKYTLKDFEQAAHHFSEYLNFAPNDSAVEKLLANTYIILGQSDQAQHTLQNVLRINPNDTAALTLLSQLEFSSGNIDAGISALKNAIKTSPDNARLHKQLAKAYANTGQTELAKSEIALYQKFSNDTEGVQKLTINVYLQTGQTGKALEIANQMLVKDPVNPNTLALIGSLYAKSSNNQRARIYFNKTLKIQDSNPAANAGLARIERQNGNIDKAISQYEKLVDFNTAGTLPMLELSEIAAQQKRTNDMISWLEKARDAAPAETQARILLAKYYLHNAQPKKAEMYIKEAIKLAPEQADVMALQGKVFITQKRYNDALPPLKKLVTKLPESTEAQSLLGEAFLRQHMLKDARNHLQKALAVQPENNIALSLLAETELKDGNPNKSLKYAKVLQKQEPDYYIGHMLEGDAWVAKKNPSRAHSAYDNAWQRQQTAPLAKRLFITATNMSNLDKAVQPLLTWLKNNPDDYSTRLYLAGIYQSNKKNDMAIKEYEKILKKIPDNSTVLNNLAWLYFLDDNSKAMDMAESAYRFSPQNPGIQDTYGWILIHKDQLEKGQRLIKQAMDTIPESLDIQYHYASSLLKSGNHAEGRQILEQLINQNKPFSGREQAKQLLKNL